MSLIESELPGEPLDLFRDWQSAIRDTDPFEGTAMALATASPDGTPSVRMVLLKGFDGNGFQFYTNYKSRKAKDLEANPRASLMFWWPQVNHQVRVEGVVEKLDAKASDDYFSTRPRLSQLSSWASAQSEVIANRRVLAEAMDRLIREHGDSKVLRPEYWGGYRLRHESIEFWENRENRLHDRIRYSRDGETWRMERLAP